MATDTKTIDATGRTLGRVASEAALVLMGKNKTTYQRNVFSGSRVVVTNAGKIKITAKKLDSIYHTQYSGIPGGLRITKGTETKAKKGMKELVRMATYSMLPDNKLKREMMKHLTVEN